MKLKPGTRLRSQVDTTEIIVVRSGDGEPLIACGGHPMIDVQATPDAGIAPADEPGEGTRLGKRYTAAEKPASSCSLPSRELVPDRGRRPGRVKEAKPLPASD